MCPPDEYNLSNIQMPKPLLMVTHTKSIVMVTKYFEFC